MAKAEQEFSTYQQPKETKYVIDFGEIFQTEDGGVQMAALMASYFSAANVRADMLVKPHFERENPKSHQEEYPLIENLSKSLVRPAATFYEYDDGRSETLKGAQPRSGEHVVIVDGAVRTGETIVRTAAHLRKLESDIVVRDAVVYMVRPEGKKLEALVQRLANEGIRLHALISASDLLQELLFIGYLSEELLQEMMTDEDFR